MLFDPNDFKGMDDQLTIANYRLSRDQLLDYAKMATTIRQAISSKAASIPAASADNMEEDKESDPQQMIQKREHKYSRDK